MPKSNKKKNAAKSRKPMDPIEEEVSMNQELRHQLKNDDSPPNSTTSEIFGNNNSPKMFRLHNSASAPYTFSSMEPVHQISQNIYHSGSIRLDEDFNANPLTLEKPPHSQKAPEVKTWRLDENSSVTKILLNTSYFDSVESMFRPHIDRIDELKTELSPFESKDKQKLNKLDSEIHFLNGIGQNDVRFINVTKNNLNLYDLVYEYNNKDPKINLCNRLKIPNTLDDSDYSCRCFALDNSKDNRIALGLNSGDVFVTSIPSDKDLNFGTGYHIKMRQNFDSLIGLAFDKTTIATSYLCCAIERGRETEHFISLYDVNQGKDLILDRDVSEKILGMQFLSSDLAVLLLNCMKSIRFVDVRERSGFASIMNLNSPLYKVAVEPYNNVQFAGVTGNNLTIFDRRYLSKALYEFQIGPQSYNISHLEWNPNRYANITCCSYTNNTMFEVDIFPTPKYQHHLIGNRSSEPQESIVTEYINKFSYGLEKINTPLSAVQNFAWCHQKPNMIIATSPCIADPNVRRKFDWAQIKVITVENSRRNVSIPPDNSILYCDDNSFNQIKLKPQVNRKQQEQPMYAHRIDSNLSTVVNESLTNLNSHQEKLELVKKIKAKPTFELKPEEMDLLYEIEQREQEMLNEKIDYDHFESRTQDIQRHIPFLAAKAQTREPINKTLQLWFTRSDINQLSITRAKVGYGFATLPGSAKALIENSYYAIKDRAEETQCLKDCWKMLLRIYSSNYTTKLQSRYGTVFPGVRRMSHKLVSSSGVKEDKITFRNKYYVSERRDDILRLVGWVPLETREKLALKLERLINSPDLKSKTRAATMSMFYLQGVASKTYLEKIATYLDSSQCASRYTPTIIQQYKSMISKMLDVIAKNDGITIKGFDKLLEEIEDPYLNIMLQFLGRRQFTYNYMQRQIMATDAIRLDDRIAIGAIHMDDESFRYTMKLMTKSLQKSHDPLSVLLISGLDDHRYAHLAMHAYLKQTNDIQTTALILCAGNCFRLSKIWERYDMRKPVIERIKFAISNNALKNTRKYSLQIVCSYMSWLQANNLTLQKSYIMTFLRKKIEFPKNDPKISTGRTQGLIACNFCGKPILPFIGTDTVDNLLAQTLKMVTGSNRKGMSTAQSLQIAELERRKMIPKSRGCPHCGRPLPRCLICKRVCIQQKDNSKNEMKDWFIWCTGCAHGGHLEHLRNWFSMNELCPAGDCKCACPKIDNIFNVGHQAKRSEQDLVNDPSLINGFNVNILSATIDTTGRSRNNSEQDKMRLVRKLCMSPIHSNSALDDFYRRGSTDSGITLNMANPLKSICSLKATTQQGGFGFDDTNLTNENGSAMSNRSIDLMSQMNAMKNPSISTEHISKQLEEFRNISANVEEEDKNDSETAKVWNVTPEIVKQSNAMRKLLQAQNIKQSINQSNTDLDSIDYEQTKTRLLTSTDNLSVELSKTQRRQHVKLVPKKQNKLQRFKSNINQVEQQRQNVLNHIDDGFSSTDPNKWIVSDRDKFGRPIATQVKVDLDTNQTLDDEPTSTQSLEKNIRFNQHSIILPAREHPLANTWLTNPQALHEFVASEMFKANVAEEKAIYDLADKKMTAQLVKEQMAKEQARKEAHERRKQTRDKINLDRSLKKFTSQTSSSYFGFDCAPLDAQEISSESDEENQEEVEEIKKLCANLDENIKVEEEEIERLRQQGFQDLNSYTTALKAAEEKKKRNSRKGKHVRIKSTPEVRIATPAFDHNDESGGQTSKEISPRQRKNSTRQTVESTKAKERKSSMERKRR